MKIVEKPKEKQHFWQNAKTQRPENMRRKSAKMHSGKKTKNETQNGSIWRSFWHQFGPPKASKMEEKKEAKKKQQKGGKKEGWWCEADPPL